MTDQIDWGAPGGQAKLDQNLAAIAASAKSIAVMYNGLIEAGLEANAALYITTEFLKAIVAKLPSE